MKALEDLMRSIKDMAGPDDAPEAQGAPPDLLLYAPCPVKLVVKDAIEAIAAAETAQGRPLTAHIPMGCTSVDPYDPVHTQQDPDKLPGVIASIGFGDFWRKDFVQTHVDAGVFQAAPAPTLSPLHEKAGLVDPRGFYTVYGATPYIFLVDTRRLGDRPAPKAWEDLLHPRFAGEVVMCGDGDDMADAVVLNLYKDFGMSGLEALAASSRTLMHSSSMVKSAGSGDKDAGTVYVIPAFFAYSTRHPAHVRAIWPEDGAAASPLYFLAKRGEARRLAPLTSFFSGGFASIESAAWFAPMDGSAPSRLPAEAKLKWIGWDFVEHNDVNALRDKLNVLFRTMVRKGL